MEGSKESRPTRPECEQLFRELSVQITDTRAQAARVAMLDSSIEKLRDDVTRDIKSLTKTVTDYHTALAANMAETKATVASAHGRIDTVRNLLMTAIGLAVTAVGWALSR